MGLCIPCFRGLITIDSTNSELQFHDGTALQTATITEGDYFPSALASEITTEMNNESAETFLASITEEGKIEVSGTAAWYPITVGGYPSLWTGGDVTLGQAGLDAIGYLVSLSNPPAALVQTSPNTVGKSFYPDQPLEEDDEGKPISTTAAFVTAGGKQFVYDFTGDSNYSDPRSLSFRYLSQESKDQFNEAFWRPYAKSGGRFQFFQDRSVLDSEEYVLSDPTLSRLDWARSVPGLPLWSLPLTMRRYVA